MRRTTATTAYLKECMGTALLELMKEKPIEKISIEEMTAKADVGRSTYFRYFKSKDEVLAFKIVAMWERFLSDQSVVYDTAYSNETAAISFFEFCLSIRSISDTLYQAGHQNAILDAYLQILNFNLFEDDLDDYYSNSFIAYGMFGLVNAWIIHGYKKTPKEMAEILMHVSSIKNNFP